MGIEEGAQLSEVFGAGCPSLHSQTRVVLLLGFAEQKGAFWGPGRAQKLTPWERAFSEI